MQNRYWQIIHNENNNYNYLLLYKILLYTEFQPKISRDILFALHLCHRELTLESVFNIMLNKKTSFSSFLFKNDHEKNLIKECLETMNSIAVSKELTKPTACVYSFNDNLIILQYTNIKNMYPSFYYAKSQEEKHEDLINFFLEMYKESVKEKCSLNFNFSTIEDKTYIAITKDFFEHLKIFCNKTDNPKLYDMNYFESSDDSDDENYAMRVSI